MTAMGGSRKSVVDRKPPFAEFTFMTATDQFTTFEAQDKRAALGQIVLKKSA